MEVSFLRECIKIWFYLELDGHPTSNYILYSQLFRLHSAIAHTLERI